MKTRTKRTEKPSTPTSSAAYRAARFAASIQLRAAKEQSAQDAIEALIELQKAIAKRRAAARRIEEAAVKVLQRFARSCQILNEPTYTSGLENWSSGQDMAPYINLLTPTSIGGFGLDGHGAQGCQLRDKVVNLGEDLKALSATDPSTFVDWLKDECKNERGGAMVTAFSAIKSAGEVQWTVRTASRGDYAFFAILPDGSVREIKYHLPDEDNCATPGYRIINGTTPKFIMTPNDKIAVSCTGRKAKYAVCCNSGAQIAAFAGIGDYRMNRPSFYNVPTNVEEWLLPPGSRLFLCSDGVRDVLHPECAFFRQRNLTAEMVIDEAKARWQTRSFDAISLEAYLEGNATDVIHTYPSGSLGKDDISVAVVNLP